MRTLMGIFERMRRRPRPLVPTPITVLGGRDTLEVVGESFHQEHLWRLVGGQHWERVRESTCAALIPETDNAHDEHAIRVEIAGGTVGHLSREDAFVYRPGVLRLIGQHGGIALDGSIVGGGERGGRLGFLGVFLDHDPSDFGLRRQETSHIPALRTGLSEAIATDLDDDSYDLSWLGELSGARTPDDVVTLQGLLRDERDLIDRHYMLSELSTCLYSQRHSSRTALDEFDRACEQHHGEMAQIRPALSAKFGCVPVVEMYRQAAIRSQKARDWTRAREWATRGLALYGDEAARPEVVEDLHKRVAHADLKLAAPTREPRPKLDSSSRVPDIETLVCRGCAAEFTRERTRGRKPHMCPTCRDAA